MGTKNNPPKYDCYKNAEPDEPMFVLLGRDRFGYFLVMLWILLRRMAGETQDVLTEARECAWAMRKWVEEKGKEAWLPNPWVDDPTTFGLAGENIRLREALAQIQAKANPDRALDDEGSVRALLACGKIAGAVLEGNSESKSRG